MVARNGGIFDFGNAKFYGSLPNRGIIVNDVVGMATTPKGLGYWVARSNGQVFAFGNVATFRDFVASPCDPVVAIFSRPGQQGYRLVTRGARRTASAHSCRSGAARPSSASTRHLVRTSIQYPCIGVASRRDHRLPTIELLWRRSNSSRGGRS